MEKLGIAAAGAVFFHPLILTAGIGALRQAALTDEIFTFIEDYLNVSPIVREPEPAAEPLRALNSLRHSRMSARTAEPKTESAQSIARHADLPW